jgi:hypothetical protein
MLILTLASLGALGAAGHRVAHRIDPDIPAYPANTRGAAITFLGLTLMGPIGFGAGLLCMTLALSAKHSENLSAFLAKPLFGKNKNPI